MVVHSSEHLTNAERSVLYYDSFAAEYDAQLDSEPGVRWARGAFRRFVAETVPSGGRLLDFGCGTGTDALWYAGRGYRVLAYDNSPAMIEQLRRKCKDPIAEQRVVAWTADYQEFLVTLGRHAPSEAVVSNFAVLDLIEDLRPLLAAFATHLAPGGHLIVSVLNPLFWKDLPRCWWWDAYLRSFGKDCLHVQGVDMDTYRRFAWSIKRAAEPYFRPAAQ